MTTIESERFLSPVCRREMGTQTQQPHQICVETQDTHGASCELRDPGSEMELSQWHQSRQAFDPCLVTLEIELWISDGSGQRGLVEKALQIARSMRERPWFPWSVDGSAEKTGVQKTALIWIDGEGKAFASSFLVWDSTGSHPDEDPSHHSHQAIGNSP